MDRMMKKIIQLIKKTGDKFIVLETESNEPYVVMPLADYEKLLEKPAPARTETTMTESQLLERINRDIGIWRGKQEKENGLIQPFQSSDLGKIMPQPVAAAPTAEAEVKIEDPDDEDGGEYYFEPVES